jgi:hypothetical protein
MATDIEKHYGNKYRTPFWDIPRTTPTATDIEKHHSNRTTP